MVTEVRTIVDSSCVKIEVLKGSSGDKTFTTIHQNNYLNANIFRALSSCS